MASSTQALFRATRRKSPAQGLFPDQPLGAAPAKAREEHDFYPTFQPEPIAALLAAEAAFLPVGLPIWEPACGAGDMARMLVEAGHQVIATDLVDRGHGRAGVDFLATTRALAPRVVTNPPYHLCNWRDGRGAWVEHALDRLGVTYMALLLSLSWPCSDGIARLLAERFPPAAVYPMAWKIDFTGEGSPPVNHCWVVWDSARRLQPTVWRALLRPRPSIPGQSSLFAAAGDPP